MPLSVVEPVGRAIETTRKVCFGPFNLSKWFLIGFCAFLATFFEYGGANLPSSPNFNVGRGGGPGSADVREAVDWIETNLVLIVVMALIILVVIIGLAALLSWLGSRGQFMFIDNITRNRGAVVEPWHEYRVEGNSAFWFRFLFGLATFLAIVAVVGTGVFIAFPDIRVGMFGGSAALGLVVGLAGMLVVAVTAGVIGLFLTDFVVPIMYLRRIPVMQAWGEFRSSMLSGRAGTFVLYVLFKIVLAIVLGVFTLVLTCATLCCAAIPYLGTHVLLLPLHVFGRSYSLHFLEQFGPEWQFFRMEDEYARDRYDEGYGRPDPDEGYGPHDEHFRPGDDYPPR